MARQQYCSNAAPGHPFANASNAVIAVACQKEMDKKISGVAVIANLATLDQSTLRPQLQTQYHNYTEMELSDKAPCWIMLYVLDDSSSSL